MKSFPDMERVVRPELLDELPADDPRAIRSRRDLRRVNLWMRHAHLIAGILRRHAPQPFRHIVDLGGGDGTLMLAVARRLGSLSRSVELTLVDRQNLLHPMRAARFAELNWKVTVAQAEVFEWLSDPSGSTADVVLANLFLHHFQPPRLRELLACVAERTELFIACEPRRFPFAGVARGLLWLIGCNAVTRHDGEVSVRAGFRDRELSEHWPSAECWSLSENSAGLFSHCFVARRVQSP